MNDTERKADAMRLIRAVAQMYLDGCVGWQQATRAIGDALVLEHQRIVRPGQHTPEVKT